MKFPDVCEKKSTCESGAYFFYDVKKKEMKNEEQHKKNEEQQNTSLIPDLSDAEEARKAFIASEIFNRKY